MEAQNQLFLLYDDQCPLCSWYTKKFIHFGFINEQTRVPFSKGISMSNIKIDVERAQNQIALINTETNQTLYGIDSLLRILAVKLPWIEIIGKFPPIHFLLSLFYRFISFNRKVIAPVTTCSVEGKCSPTKSIFWRLTYIVFAGMVVHFTVGFYFQSFLSAYLVSNHITDIYLYSAQFAIQYLIFRVTKQKNFYDYAGHLATVSLIGALILLGFGITLSAAQHFGFITEMLGPLCFGIVMCAMFIIHLKRLKILGYTTLLTLSWVVFRLSIYAFVFKTLIS